MNSQGNRYQSTCPLDCKVYVGGLTRNSPREEIERAFGHYGKLRNVFVARNPPGFAFIEYEDPQDAEDSVRALDGRNLCGVRVRVEISHGKSRDKPSFGKGGRGDRGGGGGGARGGGRDMDRDGGGPRGGGRERDGGSQSGGRMDRDGGGPRGGGMGGGEPMRPRRRSRSFDKRRHSYSRSSSRSRGERNDRRDERMERGERGGRGGGGGGGMDRGDREMNSRRRSRSRS